MPVSIKALRANCNMTQREVSKALGVSHVTYSRYESDPSTMPVGAIEKLAKMFGRSSDEILQSIYSSK